MKTLCCHTPLPEKPVTVPTVGDIFRDYGPAFGAGHRLHPRQHKVMYDIEHCRRGDFGTHWEIIDRACQCPACGNGPMITLLVVDGFGNVVKQTCPDEAAERILIAEGFP